MRYCDPLGRPMAVLTAHDAPYAGIQSRGARERSFGCPGFDKKNGVVKRLTNYAKRPSLALFPALFGNVGVVQCFLLNIAAPKPSSKSVAGSEGSRYYVTSTDSNFFIRRLSGRRRRGVWSV